MKHKFIFSAKVSSVIIALLFIASFITPYAHLPIQPLQVMPSGFEGPSNEFVALTFHNQRGYSGTKAITIDGTFSAKEKPEYASVWSWSDPQNVWVDIDGQKRGCPDIALMTSGFAQVDEEYKTTSKPIDKVEYDVVKDGQTYHVITYLYFFRSYITFEVQGDEDIWGAHVDEIDWTLSGDIYLKIGINRWIRTDPNNEMFAGLLHIEMVEIRGDEDLPSGSDIIPNSAPAALSMMSSIEGQQYGQFEFDDLAQGWQNPDNLLDKAYYKFSLRDFSSGKKLLENKVVHPWVKVAVVGKMIVSERFVRTQQQQGPDTDPWVNTGKSWLDEFREIINSLLWGADILENLLRLLPYVLVAIAMLIGIFGLTLILNRPREPEPEVVYVG